MKENKAVTIFLLTFGMVMLFPIYILFLSSFKTERDLFDHSLIPAAFTADSLIGALTPEFIRSIGNSLFVAAAVTAAAMLLHAMCGYALARMDFPGKKQIFTLIISTLMIPSTTILLPLFMVCKAMGLTNNYGGLIIPALFNAYGIFLFRQYYMDFPEELEEAARIEGCSTVRMFASVVMPLSKPMMVPLTIAFFLGTWNNYLWPLIINKKEQFQTVQVYLANMVSGYATPWNILIASAAIGAIPVFILFLIMQKQLKEGIKITGIK